MKIKLILMLLLSTAAFASSPCPAPITDVTAQVLEIYPDNYGARHCLVVDTETYDTYISYHCDLVHVGDIMTGEITTHWTHRDSQGNPVCDFQQFVPRGH